MTGRTFVLMRSRSGEANSVLRLVNRLPGVENVSRLQGPYDLVVQLRAGAHDMVKGIGDLPGVDRVVVCTSFVA